MPQLLERHRKEWEASKVSPEIIDRNVQSIEDPRVVDELLNRNTKQRWKHSDHLVPAWWVSGVNPQTGERTYQGLQVKPDKLYTDPETLKPRKYLNPGKQVISPLFLEVSDYDYWPKLIKEIDTAIAICEGGKKAGALLSLGIPAISIPGVSTGGKLGRLRPELELYARYGRTFLLFFDRDVVEKKQVRWALHNLGRMLAARGAMVYVVEWANRYKGVDDYIASGGDIHHRINQAKTLEEWKREAEENDAEKLEGETCTLARRYQVVAKQLEGRLKWNHLKGSIELDGDPAELDTLRLRLALLYNIQLPEADCSQICIYLAKQASFSPVQEYLKQVATLYPADDDLLNGMAKTYLGSEEELHRVYLRKTLISAVARAMLPGCKVDTVCILAGGQGVGKSTFWKILASEDWFDDSVGSTSDKDERLKIHQAWFIEWAELESVFKRKDISAVKAFITTQTDTVRPPYGRSFVEMQRPSIIVGSTNESEFLADATGNRRYWVIPIQCAAIPLEQLAENRDRIWAAAFHAFKSGEQWGLPPELRQVAAADALNYASADPWEDAVLDYCHERELVTTSEVLGNALKQDLDKMDKRSQMRVASILTSARWTADRKYLAGRRTRVWVKPESVGSEDGQSTVPSSEAPGGEISESSVLGSPTCPNNSEELKTERVEAAGQPAGQPTGQPSAQPVENGAQSTAEKSGLGPVDSLPDLDGSIPKSSRTEDYTLWSPGDTVEIINGCFSGRQVPIVSVSTDGQVEVKAGGWVHSQTFPFDKLQWVRAV